MQSGIQVGQATPHRLPPCLVAGSQEEQQVDGQAYG
jgi:hypothetical protein